MKKTTKKQSRAITVQSAPMLVPIGTRSSSSIYVSPRLALTASPVWQGLNVITGDISKLPFLTYRVGEGGRGKERVASHPVYGLLRRHTGQMTSNLWVSRMVGQALYYGAGYSRVYWRGSRVQWIEFLPRDRVEPIIENGVKTYLVKYPDGNGGSSVARVPEDNMIHLTGLTLDEDDNLSLVQYARNTVGRHLSAEYYADDFFANDTTPSGFFEHPGEMSEPAQDRFLKRVSDRHAGAGRRHRAAILEEGMKWTSAGINPKDALLVDQLKLSILDVARFFNLPPHKLGDTEKAAYNSLESEEKSYLSSCLGTWISRLEFECTYKLFTSVEEREGYFCEFLQDAHAKADTAARFAAYAVAIQWGIMSPNEIRERENLNPYEGGDEFQRPLTHAPATGGDPAPAPEDDGSNAARAALRDILAERLEAAARLLVNSATRAAKHPRSYLARINELSRHRPAVEGMVGAAVRAVAPGVEDVSHRLIQEAVTRCVEASDCQPEDLAERVAEVLVGLRFFCRDLATQLTFGG